MILVDANILLYSVDCTSVHHDRARTWWDCQLSDSAPVALCWPVIKAFIRIGTNSRIAQSPLTLKEAIERVQAWLDQPCTRIVSPTLEHWPVFSELLIEGQASGHLVTDAHLAALAKTHSATLISSDRDFARFPSISWENPLV